MNVEFKVCTKGTCGVSVTGLTDYATNPVCTQDGFTFVLSSTINAISRVTEDDSELVDYRIQEHYLTGDEGDSDREPVIDESVLQFGNDGIYEVTHIILPTKAWVNLYKDNAQLAYTFPNGIYCVDNGKILHYINATFKEIDVETLIELNNTGTTIMKKVKTTFSKCHLLACYYNICKKLLSSMCPTQCDASKYQMDILHRDIIWMGLNAIKYSLDLGQIYEASRIMDLITQCGGICTQYTNSNKNTTGCGCN